MVDNKKMSLRIHLTGFCDHEIPGYQNFFRHIVKEALDKDTVFTSQYCDVEIVLFACHGQVSSKHKILLNGEAQCVHGENYPGYYILCPAAANVPPEKYRWWPYASWCKPRVDYLEDMVNQRQTRKQVPKTRFCSMVRVHAHGEDRNRFIDLLMNYKRIDSAGQWKNNMPNGWRVPGFHGTEDLLDFYSSGKFVIACENTLTKGYITEKLINPIKAGSVPIYWGCPEGGLINPATYVDISKFSSMEEAIEHIKYLDNNDDAYQAMLDAPIWIEKPPKALTIQPMVDVLQMMYPLIEGHVINLDKRTDRWDQVQKEFSNVKTVTLTRFSAITSGNPVMGCTASHKAIIKMAKDRGYPFVLVMEDDCKIPNPEDFDQKFPKIIKWLKQNPTEWDVFNGGPTYFNKGNIVKVINDYPLVQLNCGMTGHMVIYNSTVYDLLLECKPTDPLDVYVSSNCRQVTTVPYLAVQYGSYSDLQHRHTDYSNIFKNSENVIKDHLSAKTQTE